ncbi:hypothetical protein GQ43DRAFT_369437 [Delitschia confertaspora ATCC 74209]|uniref:BHLH domain-containing protein n=1 Tax=Delitschia confertaspora ATCC 74209 TaxID=1513339 RepID=A0A9P4JNF9_9PLEO|nr:hypothetical protein GQ43DRAFT_369437 [Delitschia confertaspora ATCC 74209]
MADTAGYPSDAKANLGDSNHTNKRKRDARDNGAARPAPATNNTGGNTTDLSDQATASYLAAHNASANDEDMQQQFDLHQNGGANSSSAGDTAAAALAHYSMTVPQATELSFQPQTTPPEGAGFNMGEHALHQQQQGPGLSDFSLDTLKAATQTPRSAPPPPEASPPTAVGSGHKPPVGSDEWHKVRRDNHKEVERRRRETINEGINELAKIVPNCEKNKGSILQRAVQFIQRLKENEAQNIEKWTLEKLLTEQAIQELSTSCEKFKSELNRAWEELAIYKRACENAGIVPDEIKAREESNGEQNGEN